MEKNRISRSILTYIVICSILIGMMNQCASKKDEKRGYNTEKGQQTDRVKSVYPIDSINSNSLSIPYDTISFYDIRISELNLNTPVKRLIEVLGQPDSILNKYDEFANEEYEIFYYGNSSFTAEKNKLTGFDITNATYSLNNLTIGNKVESLKQIYPKSWANRYDLGNGIERVSLLITSNPSAFEKHIKIILKDNAVHSYYTWTID